MDFPDDEQYDHNMLEIMLQIKEGYACLVYYVGMSFNWINLSTGYNMNYFSGGLYFAGMLCSAGR
jgi:hypothetical protein